MREIRIKNGQRVNYNGWRGKKNESSGGIGRAEGKDINTSDREREREMRRAERTVLLEDRG